MGLVISLILNLVAPNLIQPVCDAILADLPQGLTTGPEPACGCTTNFEGFLDITGKLEASCTLAFEDKTCVLNMGGTGSAIALATGGSGSLSVTTGACDIGFGNANFQAGGEFSTSGEISLNSCSADVTNLQNGDVECSCGSIGCDGDLSAQVVCNYNQNEILNECLDFTEVAEKLEDALEENSD